MNKKTRYGIGAALAAGALITASATYAASGGDGGRTSPQFAPHLTLQTNTENGHVSVTPCRAVDTRHGGGAIAAGATRSFSITGTNLSSQGGSATGCAIPAYAAAATLNITVTGTTGSGYVTVFPELPKPGTSSLNWTASGQTIANGATIRISDAGTLQVYAAKKTHVLIDVTGYDAPPIYAIINDSSSATAPTLYSATTRLGTLTRTGVGAYQIVTIGTNSNCAASATLESGVGVAGTVQAFSVSGTMYIKTYDAGGTAADLGKFIDVEVQC